MSTIIGTRLDPFYQLFLKNFFSCNKPFFEFPRDDDFNTLISCCKQLIDSSIKLPEFGEETFNVEISLQPYDDKKGDYFLPEKAQILFQQRVMKFYQMHFHSDMAKLHNQGYEMHEAITVLIYKYGLPDDQATFERMKKDFYRWRQKKYNRKRAKKKQKKLVLEMV